MRDLPPLPHSIDCTLATEALAGFIEPRQRIAAVEQYVLAGGLWPAQLPLLGQRDANSPFAMIGSVRDIHRADDALHGVARFSRNPFPRRVLADIVDGHLADLMLAVRPLETRWLDAGESVELVGRTYTGGPLRLVVRWSAIAAMAVAIGGDPRLRFGSVARGSFDLDLPADDGKPIDEQSQGFLARLGMPEGLSNRDAIRWARRNVTTRTTAAE